MRERRKSGSVRGAGSNLRPYSTDDSVCAQCGKKETNDNVLLPIGVRNHVWLHSACWEPWRLALRAKAKRALGLDDVEVDVEVDVDADR